MYGSGSYKKRISPFSRFHNEVSLQSDRFEDIVDTRFGRCLWKKPAMS
jgi:hypothetical protein